LYPETANEHQYKFKGSLNNAQTKDSNYHGRLERFQSRSPSSQRRCGLSLYLWASSTSFLLNTSPYVLLSSQTVLGVALPSISRFLRRIKSSARSRSDNSRESLACIAGGLSFEGGAGGRKRGRDDDADTDGRTDSCRVIEVNGSWESLRDSSRLLDWERSLIVENLRQKSLPFLVVDSFRVVFGTLRVPRFKILGRRGKCETLLLFGCRFFGHLYSSSNGVLNCRWVTKKCEEIQPTSSKSSNKLICPFVVGNTAPCMELEPAMCFVSSSSLRFLFFFFSVLSNIPALSRSMSIRASESCFPINIYIVQS